MYYVIWFVSGLAVTMPMISIGIYETGCLGQSPDRRSQESEKDKSYRNHGELHKSVIGHNIVQDWTSRQLLIRIASNSWRFIL